MPYMKVTYDVNLCVDRYYRYDEGEDPSEVYDMLFDNPYVDDMSAPSAYKAVEDEFLAIPNSYEVDAQCSSRDFVDYYAPDPDEPAPHWREFVPNGKVEAYRVGKAAEQMRYDLETLLVQGDYEQIATIASLLASLRKE